MLNLKLYYNENKFKIVLILKIDIIKDIKIIVTHLQLF